MVLKLKCISDSAGKLGNTQIEGPTLRKSNRSYWPRYHTLSTSAVAQALSQDVVSFRMSTRSVVSEPTSIYPQCLQDPPDSNEVSFLTIGLMGMMGSDSKGWWRDTPGGPFYKIPFPLIPKKQQNILVKIVCYSIRLTGSKPALPSTCYVILGNCFQLRGLNFIICQMGIMVPTS